jgi:predicted nucleic acid-binding protein
MVVEFDSTKVAKVTPDIDDDPIIETAVVAKAQFLCSLDRDILDQAVISYCESHGVQVVDDLAMIGILRRTDAK